MNKYASIASKAAYAAGEFIQASAGDIATLNIEQKSLHDYVSEVDRGSEKIIYELISSEFPEHGFVGEEYGASAVKSDFQWIVDPLDGTTNFLRGIPHYAVSIALVHKGEVVHGTVFDPAKREMFSASKGAGTRLNSSPVSVSQAVSMSGGVYATGVPFNGLTLANLECFTDCMLGVLSQQTAGIRRLGSAALDLAYVAAGRYEGYWEANLKSWDIAAGALLVQEAGGLVTDLLGTNKFLDNGHILAACPGAFDPLLAISQKSYVGWQGDKEPLAG